MCEARWYVHTWLYHFKPQGSHFLLLFVVLLWLLLGYVFMFILQGRYFYVYIDFTFMCIYHIWT
jgi:hypothetical protein